MSYVVYMFDSTCPGYINYFSPTCKVSLDTEIVYISGTSGAVNYNTSGATTTHGMLIYDAGSIY